MESFKEFVNASAFQNIQAKGSDNHWVSLTGSPMPTPTLDIPTKTIEGNVRRINYTENPISILLDNGAMWNLTKEQWDYLRAINKEPKISSRMQIEMYLDGTVKAVNVEQRQYPKSKSFQTKSSKSSKTKRHLPF